jgi:hypothetical protein
MFGLLPRQHVAQARASTALWWEFVPLWWMSGGASGGNKKQEKRRRKSVLKCRTSHTPRLGPLGSLQDVSIQY